jgi:UDP-N-acetylmuramyl pentapeptide phosphotransferase/UDP-N-acetylglucosamine-1-phosphate transferase
MTVVLFAGSAVLACVLAAGITPLVARLADRIGMLDIPGGRRTHPRPIPRPGGLAIALAFGLGCRELARDFIVEYLRSHEDHAPRRPL